VDSNGDMADVGIDVLYNNTPFVADKLDIPRFSDLK